MKCNNTQRMKLFPARFSTFFCAYGLLLLLLLSLIYYFLWLCSPSRAMASSFTRFPDHTKRRATVGRTPPDEWSSRRRDFYLTTHNTQQKNFHAVGGFRTHDRSRRAAVDLRVRPRGHWDRLCSHLINQNVLFMNVTFWRIPLKLKKKQH
jgi:hypothetical protein